LEEWPREGGEGILEGNLPAAADTFTYEKRNASVLKGVKGIQRFHPSGVEIRTGNLLEWFAHREEERYRVKQNILLEKAKPIFGNYSAGILTNTEEERGYLTREIPADLTFLYLRFYLRLSSGLLANKNFDFPFLHIVYGKYLLPYLHLNKEEGGASVTLKPYYRRKDLVNIRKQKEALSNRVYLAADRSYCMEYFFQWTGTKRGENTLKVNGQEQISLDAELIDHGADPAHNLWLGKHATPPLPGIFFIDEFVLADSVIGPLPEKPQLRISTDQVLFAPDDDFLPRQSFTASHWQINDQNNWLLPFYNSGEDIDHIDSLPLSAITPAAMNSGKESPWYLRARRKNMSGSWSEWSALLAWPGPDRLNRVTGKTDSSLKVNKAFFSEIGKMSPLATLEKGAWYDLSVFLSGYSKWSDLQFAHFWWQADPENSTGNIQQLGGVFDPARSYSIGFSLASNTVWVRQKEGSHEGNKINGQLGRFIDDDQREYQKNEEQGWVRARVQILAEAEIGPWILKGFVCDTKNQYSPLCVSLFYVVPPREAGEKFSWRTGIILSSLLLAMAGLFYAGYSRKQRKMKFMEVHSQILPTEVHLTIQSASEDQIRKARDYILLNYQHPITARDVAEAIHISPNWLSKFFHRGTGKTVTQYLNEVRILEAKNLLKNSGLSITEVAARIGFNDLSNFFKVFRKLERMSPKEYKQAHLIIIQKNPH